MAQTIDIFDAVFNRPAKQRGGGRGSMYDYETWLNADAAREGNAFLLTRRTDAEDPSTGDFRPPSKNFVVQLSSKVDKVTGLSDDEVAEIQAVLVNEDDQENSDVALRVVVHNRGTEQFDKITQRRENAERRARERAIKKEMAEAEEADFDDEDDDLDFEI